ncbi:MAG: tripartite tricarboxylate transporter substrate-binding protein [Rhodospirillales bacterium]
MTAYAIASKTRLAILPNVPTFSEAGLPLEMSSWHGLYAPKRYAEDVVAKLSVSLQQACSIPRLKRLSINWAPRQCRSNKPHRKRCEPTCKQTSRAGRR